MEGGASLNCFGGREQKEVGELGGRAGVWCSEEGRMCDTKCCSLEVPQESLEPHHQLLAMLCTQ